MEKRKKIVLSLALGGILLGVVSLLMISISSSRSTESKVIEILAKIDPVGGLVVAKTSDDGPAMMYSFKPDTKTILLGKASGSKEDETDDEKVAEAVVKVLSDKKDNGEFKKLLDIDKAAPISDIKEVDHNWLKVSQGVLSRMGFALFTCSSVDKIKSLQAFYDPYLIKNCKFEDLILYLPVGSTVQVYTVSGKAVEKSKLEKKASIKFDARLPANKVLGAIFAAK